MAIPLNNKEFDIEEIDLLPLVSDTTLYLRVEISQHPSSPICLLCADIMEGNSGKSDIGLSMYLLVKNIFSKLKRMVK